MQEPGSQPGTRGQKRDTPNAMQRADPNGFEPLKTQANTHFEHLFALTSRFFFTFTGRADSLHGLQPISPQAPKAKTVRRICEVISTPNPFCTPICPGHISCTGCSDYEPRDLIHAPCAANMLTGDPRASPGDPASRDTQ